jgi:hypothetical protein
VFVKRIHKKQVKMNRTLKIELDKVNLLSIFSVIEHFQLMRTKNENLNEFLGLVNEPPRVFTVSLFGPRRSLSVRVAVTGHFVAGVVA